MNRNPHRRNKNGPVYEAVTRNIMVRVVSTYLPAQSAPEESRYSWAYMIEIENHGEESVQLISRHWVITDGMNRSEEVRGPGVVGEQPTLKPREAFRYSSGCPLRTPSGAMRGEYQMLTAEGEGFDVDIPEFSLDLPNARRVVN